MTMKRAKSVARRTTTKKTKRPRRPALIPVKLRAPSPIRGLLRTPPEVAALVEREVKARPMTPEARLRVTNGFNLQYYFGGHTFAYRNTPMGVEVLAVGWDEIDELFRRLRYEQHRGIIIGDADPWW